MVSYGFALSNKPNVLFILVDDLGAKDLSNEGSTFYETPNIDQIAIGGMKSSRETSLEKQHARFLDPNYQPNKNWWGSLVD